MLLNHPPLPVCVTATLISMWEAEAPGKIINEMGNERETGKERRCVLCMMLRFAQCVLGVWKYPIQLESDIYYLEPAGYEKWKKSVNIYKVNIF